jgi:prevent-host-death family protein
MSTHRPKVVMIEATEAKNRFGAIIKRAYEQEEHLIIRRAGLPVVAIIPVQDYEQLVNAATPDAGAVPAVAAGARAAAARTRLREFLASAHAALTAGADAPAAEQDAEQAIARAVKAVRRKRPPTTR